MLDASGSMEALWGEETRMNIAKKVLIQLVDSIEKSNPNIEVALRVFGHQSPKNSNDCLDSRLEIPFGKQNGESFIKVLNKIKPLGQTPIAYSLIQSINDFNEDSAINSIILITDGLENCSGNPCDAVKYLNEKRITINPFIIGLDIEDSLIHDFDCIGSFVNAKDEKTLTLILENTLEKATGTTTLSIQFVNEGGTELSNIPFSITDPVNQKVLYNFIHTKTKNGLQDTLYLDPRGYYQIKIHTHPHVISKSFLLESGKHNIIKITLSKSTVKFIHKKLYDEVKPRFLLKSNQQWVYNYNLEEVQVISGNYSLTTSFIPLKNESLHLKSDKTYGKAYPSNGKLSIENNQKILLSIFYINGNSWELIKEIKPLSSNYQMKLQPGAYSIIYLLESESNSDLTHRYDFEIFEEKTSVVKLF